MQKEKKNRKARSFTKDSSSLSLVIVLLISIPSLILNCSLIYSEHEQHFDVLASNMVSFLSRSLEVPLWSYDVGSIQKLGTSMSGNESAFFTGTPSLVASGGRFAIASDTRF